MLGWLGGDLAFWLASGTLSRVLRLSGLISAGIVVYFGVLWLLGVRAGQFRLQGPVGPASAGQKESG